MRFLETILTLALVICIVVWMFETEFLILDILLCFFLIALYVIIPFAIIIAVIWAIKELFR
jgi:hypothetical protein